MNKKGFTLSEVLITLGIIGVVAVLTLPSVIQKQHEKATVVKVKKMYNILSQAYVYAVKEYGLPDEWGMNNAKDMRNKLFINIKKIKNCDIASKKDECGVAGHYYYMSGTENTDLINNAYSSSLSDGTTLMVYKNVSNCHEYRGNGQFLQNQCGWIYVDVNGNKAPNTYGKDLFCFYLTKYGIIPVGTVNETSYPFSACKTDGAGCTAWLIYNENMDYLHCDDLSWNGKNKCK
jgi:prepilin-type N-terminal cleavage/methylation domain-containing protein